MPLKTFAKKSPTNKRRLSRRTKKRSNQELRATAYHEAGHAVIAILKGLAVCEVSIVPSKDFNGVCKGPSVFGYIVSSCMESRQIARDSILTLYAGMAAERLADLHAPQWHGQRDDEDAFNYSRQFSLCPRGCIIGDDRHLAYLGKLRGEASRLVKKYRAAIEAVATALLGHRTLTRDQIMDIVAEFVPNLPR